MSTETTTNDPPLPDDLPPVAAVGDLTADHYGWYIEVAEPDTVIRRRQFTLKHIRRWTNDNGPQVGLLDGDADGDGLYRGTERHYPADRPAKVLRRVTRRRRKARAR